VNGGIFTDGITRLGGSLILRGAGSIVQSSAITITVGGSLILDNSGTVVTDRVSNSAPISLAGGELRQIGNATTAVTETFGVITLDPASATIGGLQHHPF